MRGLLDSTVLDVGRLVARFGTKRNYSQGSLLRRIESEGVKLSLLKRGMDLLFPNISID